MTNTVKVFKIADPILQSIIFLTFAYSFDYSNYYRLLLPSLIGWQLLSSIIHLFIHTRSKLKLERLIYFVLVITFITIFLFLRNHIKERYFQIFATQGPLNIPIYELSFVALEGLFSFWYYIICFREIHKVLKKIPQ